MATGKPIDSVELERFHQKLFDLYVEVKARALTQGEIKNELYILLGHLNEIRYKSEE